MELKYNLDKALLQEYYGYLAVHDAKIQKKMVTLMVGIASITIILCLILFDLSMISLIAVLICLVLLFFIFPKLYWKMVLDKANEKVNKLTLDYKEMNVELDKLGFFVKPDTKILFKEVMNVGFTKNCCLVFYRHQEVVNTLIIPVSAVEDMELFLKLLEAYKI